MRVLVRSISVIVAFTLLALLTACSPEVGSEKWCSKMKEKAKTDWTANEISDYAKHCVLK